MIKLKPKFPFYLQSWTKLVELKVEITGDSRNGAIFQISNSCPYSPISMLNLAKFCCQKPKTTVIWGRERTSCWKINFLFCFYSFVQNCSYTGESRDFWKKDDLWNFVKFTEKHLCHSLHFNKVAGLSLLIYSKRDSSTGVLLWILRNFTEDLFCDCFCRKANVKNILLDFNETNKGFRKHICWC